MTSGFDAANSLTDDDFRRLGIRLREARMPVIRSAAMRSSSALADQQLTSPSDQVQLQLARVAASTYRILNPRLRSDFLQRISLGRVSPEALFAQSAPDFGGQPFAPRSRQDSVTDVGDTESPGVILVGDEFLTKISRLDHSPIAKNGERVWTDSLSDHDLLARPSNWKRIRSRARSRRPLLITGALACAGLLWITAQFLPDNAPAELMETRSTEPAPQNPVSPETRSSPAPQQTPTGEPIGPEIPQPATEPDPSTSIATERPKAPEHSLPENRASAASDVDTDSLPPGGSATAVPPDPAAIATGAATADTATDAPAVFGPDRSAMADGTPVENTDHPQQSDLVMTPDDADDGPGAAEMNADADSVYLADPFDLDASATPTPPDPVEVAENSVKIHTSDDPANPAAKFLPPSAVDLASAKRRIRADLSQPAGSAFNTQSARQVQRAVEFAGNQPPGAIDHYAGLMISVEAAWLAPETCSLGSRVDAITDAYQIDSPTVAVDTLIRALQQSSTPESRRSLFWSGCWLVDHCLINEHVALSKRLLVELNATAQELGDDATNEQADSLTSDVVLAERFWLKAQAQSASTPDQTTPAVAGIVGRYHCLVRRDWEKGLAWLAAGSAVKLASTAELEIELVFAPDPGKQIAVAARWATLAGDQSGRSELAMRLHAIDLANAVVEDSQASNLVKTQARKLAQTQTTLLPAFMTADPLATREAAPTTTTALNASSAPAATAVRGGPADTAVSAMGGSLQVMPAGGFAFPLRYELGGTISTDLLKRIEERVGTDLTGAELQLSGAFQLAKPTKIRVSLPGTTASSSTVTLDGVGILPGNNVPTDLPAGRHVIAWTLQTKDLGEPRLTIVEHASNVPIMVTPNRTATAATADRTIVIKSPFN